jgi:DNA-binding NarL/FixJ family response regulator
LPDLHASLPPQSDEDATLRILLIGPRTAEPFSLRDALERSSTERWRVSEVEGTEEGVTVLHTERFHLLVVDDSRLMSSRRNSLEILRQAAPSIPIILRTTYQSHQAEADAAQVGAEAVLPREAMLVLCQAVLRIARRIDSERASA